MKKIILRVIIIDDEENAILVLSDMLNSFSSIKIVGIATNLNEGVKVIKQTQPDIVFLDINMPFRNGFEIYNEFNFPDFKIIFTTASEEYGFEAKSRNAFAYLLKPIDFIELQFVIENFCNEFSHELNQFEFEDDNILPMDGGIKIQDSKSKTLNISQNI
jgi:two-component system, LytTR family, response regulator